MSNKIRFASEQFVEDKIKDINISGSNSEIYCNLTISSDGTIAVNNNGQLSFITGTLIQSGCIINDGTTNTSRINRSSYEFSYKIYSENYNTLKEQLRVSEKIKVIFSNEEKLLYGITNSYSEIGYAEGYSDNRECDFSGLYFNFGSILIRLYKETGSDEPV